MAKPVLIVFLLFLVISASTVSGAELSSDISKAEENELALDEAVLKAESERIDLLFESIRLALLSENLEKAEKLLHNLLVTTHGRDNMTDTRIQYFGYSIVSGHHDAGNMDKALVLADRLLEDLGEDAILYHIKSLIYSSNNDDENAREWREKAAMYRPDDDEYRISIARFLADNRKFEPAIEELQRVLRRGDKDSEYHANAYYYLGWINYRKGDFQEAVKNYGELARILQQRGALIADQRVAKEIIFAHIAAARDHEIKGEHEKELEILLGANTFYSDSDSLQNALGGAYARLGKYDEAVKSYEKAVGNPPSYPEALIGLGDVLEKLDKNDEAKQKHDKAVELYKKLIESGEDDDSIATALNNLAWFYATHNRNIEEGIELSKRSLEIRPEEPAYYDTLAELYFLNGEIDKALEFIKKALEGDPHHRLYYEQQMQKFIEKKTGGQ